MSVLWLETRSIGTHDSDVNLTAFDGAGLPFVPPCVSGCFGSEDAEVLPVHLLWTCTRDAHAGRIGNGARCARRRIGAKRDVDAIGTSILPEVEGDGLDALKEGTYVQLI